MVKIVQAFAEKSAKAANICHLHFLTVAAAICAPPSSLKLFNNVLVFPIFFQTGTVPFVSWQIYMKEEGDIFHSTILSVHCYQLILCNTSDIMCVHILHVLLDTIIYVKEFFLRSMCH